jgi:hypothetical protein
MRSSNLSPGPADRHARLALVAVALGLAALTVTSPVANANKAYGPTFKHLKSKASDSSSGTGCATGTHVNLTTFNTTDGLGGIGESASSLSCNSFTNTSISEIGSISLALGLGAARNQLFLGATWYSEVSGFANLTSGTCTLAPGWLNGSCSESAVIFVHGSAVILDKATGRKVASSDPWSGVSYIVSNSTTCAMLGCSSSSSKSPFVGLTHSLSVHTWNWTGVPFPNGDKLVLKIRITVGTTVVISTNGTQLSGCSVVANLCAAGASYPSPSSGDQESFHHVYWGWK